MNKWYLEYGYPSFTWKKKKNKTVKNANHTFIFSILNFEFSKWKAKRVRIKITTIICCDANINSDRNNMPVTAYWCFPFIPHLHNNVWIALNAKDKWFDSIFVFYAFIFIRIKYVNEDSKKLKIFCYCSPSKSFPFSLLGVQVRDVIIIEYGCCETGYEMFHWLDNFLQ